MSSPLARCIKAYWPWGNLQNGGFWGLKCPLAGSLSRRGHIPTNMPFPTLSPPCGERIMCPSTPQRSPLGSCVLCVHSLAQGTHCIDSRFPMHSTNRNT